MEDKIRQPLIPKLEAAAGEWDANQVPIHKEGWLLVGELLREFRHCNDWPKGA